MVMYILGFISGSIFGFFVFALISASNSGDDM